MHRKLRGKFKELDIDYTYLASKLGICNTSISLRMNSKEPWRIDEMYAIMDLIHEPYERLHEYFPKGGLAAA